MKSKIIKKLGGDKVDKFKNKMVEKAPALRRVITVKKMNNKECQDHWMNLRVFVKQTWLDKNNYVKIIRPSVFDPKSYGHIKNQRNSELAKRNSVLQEFNTKGFDQKERRDSIHSRKSIDNIQQDLQVKSNKFQKKQSLFSSQQIQSTQFDTERALFTEETLQNKILRNKNTQFQSERLSQKFVQHQNNDYINVLETQENKKEEDLFQMDINQFDFDDNILCFDEKKQERNRRFTNLEEKEVEHILKSIPNNPADNIQDQKEEIKDQNKNHQSFDSIPQTPARNVQDQKEETKDQNKNHQIFDSNQNFHQIMQVKKNQDFENDFIEDNQNEDVIKQQKTQEIFVQSKQKKNEEKNMFSIPQDNQKESKSPSKIKNKEENKNPINIVKKEEKRRPSQIQNTNKIQQLKIQENIEQNDNQSVENKSPIIENKKEEN